MEKKNLEKASCGGEKTIKAFLIVVIAISTLF
jgi:hypothetical protein